MGTDVRKLVWDGYPGHNVLACDIRQDFIDIGYDIYKDKESCPIHFFESDIFAVPLEPSPSDSAVTASLQEGSHLKQLRGRINHVHSGSVFHLVR